MSNKNIREKEVQKGDKNYCSDVKGCEIEMEGPKRSS